MVLFLKKNKKENVFLLPPATFPSFVCLLCLFALMSWAVLKMSHKSQNPWTPRNPQERGVHRKHVRFKTLFQTSVDFCHPWLGSQLAFFFFICLFVLFCLFYLSDLHDRVYSFFLPSPFDRSYQNLPTPGFVCMRFFSAQESVGVLERKEKVGRNHGMESFSLWSFMSQAPSLATFSNSEPLSVPAGN